MAKNSSKDRAILSPNQKTLLLTQVEYLCPKCQRPLQVTHNGRLVGRYQIAHIYPHSPTPQEAVLLENVERLSSDPESLDNLIPLCNNCHVEFDNPRTVAAYEEMVAIKKRLIRDQRIKGIYTSEIIEQDIISVVHALSSMNETDVQELSYDAVAVDDKLRNCKNNVFKRKIKNNVVQYFPFVQQQFRDIEALTPGQFDVIATQIKGFYVKAIQIEKTEEAVFSHIIDWLSKKTGCTQNTALEIIVSFFVQNCEVFTNASK